jgi:hypothetical protein
MRLNLSATLAATAVIGLTATLMLYSEARAAAIIDNGTVQLGVRDLGNLNVPGGPFSAPSETDVVGLRFLPTNSDSASASCLCEGWGAGILSLGASGYANVGIGTDHLSLVSFTSTPSTAVSLVNVLNASGAPILEVKHDYHPVATTPYLYEVGVSIKNISGADLAAGDLVYRRVMDWDVPVPGSERVSIQGVPANLGVRNGNNIRRTDNNGFNSGNPFSFSSFDLFNTNFTDASGDIGALFDFEFEALANGATRKFATYYGAAPDKVTADLARTLVDGDPGDVEIGLYSYGVCSVAGCDVAAGSPNTFIFGFGAASGVLIPPENGESPTIPEPATLSLLGLGLLGMARVRTRKRRIAQALT